MARENENKLQELSHWANSFPSNQIAEYQLSALNQCWARASSNIAYYRRLKAHHKLPTRFESLHQYRKVFPITEKCDFQNEIDTLHYTDRKPDDYRISGGSTAKPVQLPLWKHEYDATRLDPWLARSWYDIKMKDCMFLYWGHSHLLGTGYRRYINIVTRYLKDHIQNYVRHSCYDSSPSALHAAGKAIVESKPKFIVGYSSCLDALAKANIPRRSEFHRLGLRAVIGTAEAFPFDDSVETIKDVFGCPVGMEYGSVETNLMGHTHPYGGYRVFWWNNLLDFDGHDPIEVLVTTLYSRCTPLFRYRIGDKILGGQHLKVVGNSSVVEFDRVFGRSNLAVQLPSGRTIHSEAITHIVRQFPQVSSYQMVCKPNRLELQVVLKQQLTPNDIELMKSNASKIDPELGACVQIVDVKWVKRSIAGKTPIVVFEKT